jgi:hypothetical protein
MKAKKHAQQEKQTTQPEAKHSPQPQPFTPGITKAMVRQHAFELYRDKLAHESLNIEDWVLAEKDLVHNMQTDNLSR